MFDLQRFVIAGHEKIIGHYRKLLETARSDEERAFYRSAIARHDEAIERLIDQIDSPMRRAA